MKKQFVFFCLFILALQVHAQDSLIVKPTVLLFPKY